MELRLNEAQTIQAQWERSIQVSGSVRDKVNRFVQEVEELQEAVGKEDLNKEETAMEAIDCLIVLLGVISALDYTSEELFMSKMDINYRKYNPYKHKELIDLGMSPQEATSYLKKKWKNGPSEIIIYQAPE